MQNDRIEELEALASRLELGKSDMLSRRIAEQQFRAVGVRFVANAIRMAASRAWRRLGASLAAAPAEDLPAERRENPV